MTLHKLNYGQKIPVWGCKIEGWMVDFWVGMIMIRMIRSCEAAAADHLGCVL